MILVWHSLTILIVRNILCGLWINNIQPTATTQAAETFFWVIRCRSAHPRTRIEGRVDHPFPLVTKRTPKRKRKTISGSCMPNFLCIFFTKKMCVCELWQMRSNRKPLYPKMWFSPLTLKTSQPGFFIPKVPLFSKLLGESLDIRCMAIFDVGLNKKFDWRLNR